MRRLALIILLLLSFEAFSQKGLITMSPIDFNGGLAGNAGYDRLSFHSFNMIHQADVDSMSPNYKKIDARLSYDWLSQKLKGGVGVDLKYGLHQDRLLVPNEQVDSLLITERFFSDNRYNGRYIAMGVTYSPKFIFWQRYGFSPFVYAAFEHSYNHFYFSRVDNNKRLLDMSYSYLYVDGRTGFLVNKANWFFGYTLKYFTLLGQNSWGDTWHNFQAGRFFAFTKDSKYAVGGIIQYRMPSNFISFNANVKLSRFTIGYSTWDRYGGVQVTFQCSEKIKLGYALRESSKGNLHELGFQYLFKKKEEDKLFSIPIKN